jgi:hypothetical protein
MLIVQTDIDTEPEADVIVAFEDDLGQPLLEVTIPWK